MEYIVGITVVAAMVGSVLWNHRTKSACFAGIGFEVPLPSDQVTTVIRAVYCQGAKASVRSTFSGVSVVQDEPAEFAYATKLGDTGRIRITAVSDTRSLVEAETTSLYIGGVLLSDSGSPIWQLSKTLTHLIYRMLGFAPYATKMKRFQHALERKVTHQVRRQLQT